ncbi:amidohydrolase [Diaminobutyricibacter sp. McL0618]|uniref:amidohydrolase n=1 Tax=Leifsonia sp. McL0618 TaxID=3415677 RepID=UPI003CEEFF6F
MSERTDLVVRAGTILTPRALAGDREDAAFVAIRDGNIVHIGTAPELAEWSASAERVVDTGDATLTAGLVDAHIHPIMGIEMARGLDLSGITNRDAARRALAEYVATQPGEADHWIVGWGLDPAVFDGGAFDNSLFDGIADDRLVFLMLFDGHSALVSNPALAAAGVTGRETFQDAARVGVDASGTPTGMLFELSAQELVRTLLPELSFGERVDAAQALFRSMAETGLTGGQMLDLGAEDTFEILEELERRGELAIRLRVSPWIMPGHTHDDLEQRAALQGRSGRRWHVDGIKLMIDGTVDNGTAWLFEPDTHGESTESLWLEPAEYATALAFFHERGIATATHAIGDQGISFVARTIGAQPANGTVHRIEHIETLPDVVLDEIIASGAAASMQPTHCALYTRADQTDNWSMRLGRERADHAWRTRDLRERGAIVALGSDWPIAPFDPREIIAAAQLRRPAGRADIAPVRPDQALTAINALEGYTSEYWRSVGEPGGTIVTGARADLAVFADNPLVTDPDAFATSPVLLTVVDGEIVVDRT